MNNKLLCIGALSLSVIACSSNQAPAASANSAANNASDVVVAAPVTDTSNMHTTDNSNGNNGLNQASNSVYFGVNRYDVDSQYDSVVSYNSNYLASHQGAAIKVEGNTDDTGSIEYNLALGQRRADAVKKALIAKGASVTQIEATSNGKMLAKFSNDSEDGRGQNRRSDIVYTKQAPTGYYLNQNELPAIK